MTQYLIILTTRAKKIKEASTLLGPFTTEKDACRALVTSIIKPFKNFHNQNNALLDICNLRDRINDDIDYMNKDGAEDDNDLDDDQVMELLNKCDTVQELDEFLSLWEPMYNDVDVSGMTDERYAYGWTFTLHKIST